MKKQVVLVIAGEETNFLVTAENFTTYINDVMPDDKVSASYGLCKNSVIADDREAFEKNLNLSVAIQVSAMLVKEYQGEVSVTLKK